MTLIEKILSAAREVATERSLDDVTIAEVARRAGVSRQTVYHQVGGVDRLKETIKGDLASSQLPGQDEDTRSRLLAAARRVFAEHGYEHSTLDQVAADAGLSKGAVYWHFSSKGDLFITLMEEQFRRQRATTLRSVEEVPAGLSQEEALAAIVREQFLACQADPAWPSLSLEFLGRRRDPESRARLTSFVRSVRQAQADVITRLQEQGGLPDGLDPATLAVLFDAFSTGITIAWLIDPEQIDPADAASALIRLLWNGLKTGNP